MFGFLAAIFGPILIGGLVGSFFTVRGKWAERFDDWPVKSLLLIPPIAIGTFGSLFAISSIEHSALILEICWVMITVILFAGGFMRWTKKA